jgi:hypothetical protein
MNLKVVDSYALQDHLKDPFSFNNRLNFLTLAIYGAKIDPKHYSCAFIITVRLEQLLMHQFN